MSNGWVYSVLDYCQGGDAYVAEVTEVTDQAAGGSGSKVEYTALYAAKEDEGVLVVGTSSLDRNDTRARTITCSIPSHLLTVRGDSPAVFETELTERNCVHAAVKRDLEAEKCLNPAYAGKPQLAQVKYLYDPDQKERAGELVAANTAEYEQIVVNTLSLQQYGGKMSDDGDSIAATFDVYPASVKVIVFKHTADEVVGKQI